MVDLGNFNPDEHEPMTSSFEPMPRGTYRAMIVKSSEHYSQAGNKYLTLAFEIDGDAHPEFKRRTIFYNLNFWHPTDSVRELARGQLSMIAKACGVKVLTGGSEALHLIPMHVQVGIDEYNGKKKNVITTCTQIEDAQAPPASAPPAAETTAQPDAPGWART